LTLHHAASRSGWPIRAPCATSPRP
jgi:hypothetical protein